MTVRVPHQGMVCPQCSGEVKAETEAGAVGLVVPGLARVMLGSEPAGSGWWARLYPTCLLLYLGGSSPLETEQRPREGDSKMVQAVAPPQPWGTSPWLLPRGSGAYQEGDASPASTC